jgi:hypothetical protein
MPTTKPQWTPLTIFAFGWGILGVCASLITGLLRLSPRTLEALAMELDAAHWIFAVTWTVFMAYTEGYRGFQRRFSPTVVARAVHLTHEPRFLRVTLAPFFCMGFFHGTRKRVILSWSLTVGIICLVLFVHSLAQPWRGLIDLGVLVGLTWGMASIAVLAIRAAQSGTSWDPQLPHDNGVEGAQTAMEGD